MKNDRPDSGCFPSWNASILHSYVFIFPYAASELHRLLQPFLLRRVKAQVATELPKKTEVVVYHGMSALQKKYYKAILMKDLRTRLWLSEAERVWLSWRECSVIRLLPSVQEVQEGAGVLDCEGFSGGLGLQ